jgi:site-specific recombinase XerD
MATKRKTEAEMSRATVSMLIEFYIGDMQRRGCTNDSVTTNRRSLTRLLRFFASGDAELRLSSLTTERVNAYVTDIQSRQELYTDHPSRPSSPGSLSPYTVRKEVRILRGFGTWLTREGFLNPFEDLQVPKVPHRIVDVITAEEKEKILGSINPNTDIGARLYSIVWLMMDTGLRIGEVAAIRLPDVDMERQQFKVMGKGQKERLVPFGQKSAQMLMRYIHVHRPTSARAEHDHLFLSLDGLPLTRNALESMIRRLRITSGVKRLHAHLLRHTFVHDFLMAGGDIMDLMDILGHTSLEVTRMYRHLTKQQVVQRYKAHSPMDKMDISGWRRFGNKRRKT